MGTFWASAVETALQLNEKRLFLFVHLATSVQLQKSDLTNNTDLGVFLTDYYANHEIAGNEYVSDLFQEASMPAQTGLVNQQLHALTVAETLNNYTGQDFVSALGSDYQLANVTITAYCENASGTLLTGAANVVFKTSGILAGITRDLRNKRVQVNVSGAWGQLKLNRELRTTVGSLKRISTTDSSFNRASALDENLSLQWGQEV